MRRLILLIPLALLAGEPLPEEIAARDARIAQQAAYIRLLQIQADPVYRMALEAVEAANAALQKANAALAAKLGCQDKLDPEALKCRVEKQTEKQ